MYILIRDFADDQIHLIHINEVGYNSSFKFMWIENYSNNSIFIPISKIDYEIVVKQLFEMGKVDLSDTDLRALDNDDLNALQNDKE